MAAATIATPEVTYLDFESKWKKTIEVNHGAEKQQEPLYEAAPRIIKLIDDYAPRLNDNEALSLSPESVSLVRECLEVKAICERVQSIVQEAFTFFDANYESIKPTLEVERRVDVLKDLTDDNQAALRSQWAQLDKQFAEVKGWKDSLKTWNDAITTHLAEFSDALEKCQQSIDPRSGVNSQLFHPDVDPNIYFGVLGTVAQGLLEIFNCPGVDTTALLEGAKQAVEKKATRVRSLQNARAIADEAISSGLSDGESSSEDEVPLPGSSTLRTLTTPVTNLVSGATSFVGSMVPEVLKTGDGSTD